MSGNNLKRIEIIASQSLEDIVMQRLEQEKLASCHTKIPAVMGHGYTDPKEGNHVWPELNFMLIIYCGDSEAAKITKLMDEIREQHPKEGISCFCM
ncbi:MAG: hypothetical protein B0D92_03515 [Spirochaeta sp. LUC14_002_19_P3]|nr:MAG: hypothetical protein B0D92_03515 [Spirochaeta sp. LUC14_002_19_P3]